MILARRPLDLPWWGIAALGAAAVAGVAMAVSPLLVLGILAAAVLAALAIYAPGVVLGLYLVVPPFFKAAVQPYLPVDVTVLLALPCAAQAVYLLSREHVRWAGVIAWGALALLVVEGTVWAPEPWFSSLMAQQWIALAALPLLAAFRVVSSPRQVVLFVAVLVASGVLVAVVGASSATEDARLVVFEGDVIGTGRAAWIPPLAAIVLLANGNRSGLLLGLLAVPAIITGLASGARGPLVAFVGTLAIAGLALLLVGRVNRTRLVMAGAGLALVAVVTVALFGDALPADAVSRFGSIVDVISDPSSVSQGNGTLARAELWIRALDQFGAHPLAGLGTGGFAFVLATSGDPFISGELYPHNFAFQVAAEFGLLGLVLVGLFLWLAFRQRPRGVAWDCLTLLAVYFALNALVSSSVYTNRLFWGLLVVLAAAPRQLTSTDAGG